MILSLGATINFIRCTSVARRCGFGAAPMYVGAPKFGHSSVHFGGNFGAVRSVSVHVGDTSVTLPLFGQISVNSSVHFGGNFGVSSERIGARR
jgi:hypothetical protein